MKKCVNILFLKKEFTPRGIYPTSQKTIKEIPNFHLKN